MSVLTSDILVTGIKRDDAFQWLSDAENHLLILEGAFDQVTRNDAEHFELAIATPGRRRIMGYRFVGADDTHGGRRVIVETTGKRTTGKLHYSLRTMRPSINTLVTLHMDYDPGGPLGGLVNSVGLRSALEAAMGKMLQNISRNMA